MKRRSQTELAVLGALSVEPMSGYALKEAIRDVLGHFWSESFGQIYPKLNELLDAGLVSRLGGGRTGSSVYSITLEGEERLRALLTEPIQPTPPRNGLMLRLFFGRHLGPEACRQLVTEAKEEAMDHLSQFDQIRAGLEAEEPNADLDYWLLTVSAGEHTAKATIEWADESLARLEDVAPNKGNES